MLKFERLEERMFACSLLMEERMFVVLVGFNLVTKGMYEIEVLLFLICSWCGMKFFSVNLKISR